MATAVVLVFCAIDANAARTLLKDLMARAPAGADDPVMSELALEACVRRAQELDRTGTAIDYEIAAIDREAAEALLLQKQLNRPLEQSGAVLQFGPAEGPGFFTPHGWQPLEVHSMLKTAARLRRLSFMMRMLAFLPESKAKQGRRPWSAVCLMGR